MSSKTKSKTSSPVMSDDVKKSTRSIFRRFWKDLDGPNYVPGTVKETRARVTDFYTCFGGSRKSGPINWNYFRSLWSNKSRSNS